MERTISWEEDYRIRINPKLLTELLHEAVPVTNHVNLKISETAEGYAKMILPLNYEATNQHGTHQAALMALAGDYTGGIAIATLLQGVPIIGVHPQTTDNGAALWLVSFNIKYLIPSADDLTISAKIPAENFERIRRKYDAGERNIESVEIFFESEGVQVATATFTYFLIQSKYLKPQSPKAKLNTLFGHRIKTSARLIAALRAMENMAPVPLYSDLYSEAAAKEHGKLLAERFTVILPQLKHMVAARTKDIDDLLLQLVQEKIKQIVFIGAGFDFRIFRVFSERQAVKVFELDLPYMLAEREKVISSFNNLPPIQRKSIGINLELEAIDEAMVDKGFDPAVASFFIIEGTSMYLSDCVNRKVLSGVYKLMQHPDSLVWIDIVAKSVIEKKADPKVQEFLNGMEKLGEPFVFGLEDGKQFFSELGYKVYRSVPSNRYISSSPDSIYEFYNFYILKRDNL